MHLHNMLYIVLHQLWSLDTDVTIFSIILYRSLARTTLMYFHMRCYMSEISAL